MKKIIIFISLLMSFVNIANAEYDNILPESKGLIKRYDVYYYENGMIVWKYHDKTHRDDGPAIILNNGSKFWYKNDKLHRDNGPAIELSNGSKLWFIEGKLHRTNGPAIENISGTKEWYINGERHRIDGPAIENGNGAKFYFINGKQYSKKDYDILVGKIITIDGEKYQPVN